MMPPRLRELALDMPHGTQFRDSQRESDASASRQVKGWSAGYVGVYAWWYDTGLSQEFDDCVIGLAVTRDSHLFLMHVAGRFGGVTRTVTYFSCMLQDDSEMYRLRWATHPAAIGLGQLSL